MSKVSAQYLLTCIQRPPLYKGHYEVALAWPLNTGFTVCEFLAFCFNSSASPYFPQSLNTEHMHAIEHTQTFSNLNRHRSG